MASGLDVVAHPTGPWLVRAGRVLYAVPPAYARPLLPWRGRRPGAADLAELACPTGVAPGAWRIYLAALAAGLAEDGRTVRRAGPAVWLRLPLVPARCVRAVARRMAPGLGRRGAAALLVIGVVGYLHLALTTRAAPVTCGPAAAGMAVALFVATALLHEFGHAVALARAGYPPGAIGAGVLWVVPVLFADVSAVGALPPRARLPVDLAGVLVQFGAGGALAAVAPAPGSPAALAAWLALGAIVWSLVPFVRTDGYWVLGDLLEVADLATGPLPPGRVRAGLLRVYRLLNATFLVALAILLPLRYAGAVRALATDVLPEPGRLAADLVGAGLLLGVWWRLGRRVAVLLRAAVAARAGPGRTTDLRGGRAGRNVV